MIDATINVVSRLNYDRATTALIAKESGVNEALIYTYYKSKRELQLSALDYLIDSRLEIYRSNPVFRSGNRCQCIMRSLNAQYLKMIQSPEIHVFSFILKAMTTIDPEIQQKGISCIKTFQKFISNSLIEDRHRGFFKDCFDPDIVAWEIIGKVILFSTLAVAGGLEQFDMNALRTSIGYLESIYLK